MMLKKSSSDNLLGGVDSMRQREITRRRIWPAALAALFYFVYHIAGVIIAVAKARTYAELYDYRPWQIHEEMTGAVSQLLGVRQPGYLFTVLFAVILAIQGFSWLDSRQQMDFYESQPVSRAARFRALYLNSFLLFAIPYAATLIPGILIAAVMGAMEKIVLLEIVYVTLRLFILFLAVYSVAVLATVLTGHILIAILGTFVFLFYECGLCLVISLYMRTFFATCYEQFFWIRPRLSPLFNYLQMLSNGFMNDDLAVADAALQSPAYNSILSPEQFAAYLRRGIPGDLGSLVIFLVVTVLAYICYKRRPGEAAGTAIPFAWVRFVVKLAVAVLGSLLTGLLIVSVVGSAWTREAQIIMVAGMLFAGAVICCIMQIIYEFDFRALFHGAWVILVSAAVTIAVFCVFRFDLVRYDSFLPDPAGVESAALMPRVYGQNYYDESGRAICDANRFYGRYMELTDIEAVEELARIAQENTVRLAQNELQPNEEGYGVNLLYRMKDGRRIYRSVVVPASIDATLMDRLLGSREFKEGYFSFYHDEGLLRNSSAGSLTYTNGHGAKRIPEQRLDAFKEAYRKDIEKNLDYTMLHTQYAVGIVSLSRADGAQGPYYGGETFPVYACYDHSIAWLKDAGLWIETEPDPEDVQEIVVTNYHSELYVQDAAEGKEMYQEVPAVTRVYTDQGKIRQLLRTIQPVNFDIQEFWHADDAAMYNYSVVVVIKPDSNLALDDSYLDNNRYDYRFQKSMVPAFVEKDTAVQ